MGWERVAGLDDLEDGAPTAAQADRVPLCLVRAGDEVLAVHDVCSHQEYALHEGIVEGGHIECALHGSMFDLRTGAPDSLPAVRPIPTYACKVDADGVWVDADQQTNDAPVPEHF